MHIVFRYIRLWSKLSIASFLTYFVTRWNVAIFLLGKLLRFTFFIIFLLTILQSTNRLAEYSSLQVLFFYFTFTLLDDITQLFYREVYRFRELVVSGDFDLVLAKPMNALFRALAGGADPLDIIMLVPYIGALLYVGLRLGPLSAANIFFYVTLFANGFLIATGFHILILALAVVTTEIDHAVMIYRDITSMGRLPVDIYREPLRSIITFVVPVGVMMTFPAKALMGLLSPGVIVLSFVFGFAFFLLSLRVWRYALSQYSSASS